MLVNSKQMWEKVGQGEENGFIENYHKTNVFIVKDKRLVCCRQSLQLITSN
jgi:hypothetical protein